MAESSIEHSGSVGQALREPLAQALIGRFRDALPGFVGRHRRVDARYLESLDQIRIAACDSIQPSLGAGRRVSPVSAPPAKAWPPRLQYFVMKGQRARRSVPPD